MKKQKTQGMSLLEMLLVVGVVSLLVGLIAMGMGDSTQQRQADELRQGVVLLKRQFQSYYQGTSDYTGISAGNAIRLRYITTTSQPFRNVGGVIQHNLGGNVTLAAVAGGQFTIRLTAVPRYACINLAPALVSDPSFMRVQVRTTTYTPATIGNAANSCAAAGSTMIFTFR